MCNGIGQRKIKLFLNKKIKAGDKIADLYRTALEIENCNINAKKYRNTMYHSYKDNLYDQKEELLKDLLQKCFDYNKEAETPLVYGYQHASNYSTNMLLYFDLPGVRQISFHCNITKKEMPEGTPEYTREWDEEVNSTLFKIEEAINERYKEDLEKISSKK